MVGLQKCYDCAWGKHVESNSDGLSRTEWMAWFHVNPDVNGKPMIDGTLNQPGQDRMCKRVCSGPSISNCVVS